MNANLLRIRRYVKEHGFVVKVVEPSKLFGFDGLNEAAVEAFGHPSIGEKVILVDKRMSGNLKYRTILHEMEEFLLMREKGLTYWQAHKIAFRGETKGIPKD